MGDGVVMGSAGEIGLLSVLEAVACGDGPVRLYRSASGEGLLQRGKKAHEALVDQLLGTLVEEVARAGNQPRRVMLTAAGVRFLIRHEPPVARARHVRGASPLYRARLLRAWKELAAPGEEELLQACIDELYGDLLEARPDDTAEFERNQAKELVLSWSRAEDPQVRAGLARAMTSLGLRPIGEEGDQVAFSGKLHVSEESLFKGDPVEIVLPGWSAPGPSGSTILQKAHVKLLP